MCCGTLRSHQSAISTAALVAVSARLQPLCPPPQPPPAHPPACRVLPLMIGWFALNVPSGLSLYYFSNTLFTTATQVYLKKLGGGWVRQLAACRPASQPASQPAEEGCCGASGLWPQGTAAPGAGRGVPRPITRIACPRLIGCSILISPAAGASLADYDLGPIELGKARRTGVTAQASMDGSSSGAEGAEGGDAAGAAMAASVSVDGSLNGNVALAAAGEEAGSEAAAGAALAMTAAAAEPKVNRRCKRRKQELLEASA